MGFLTNHARVLMCIAHDPGIRLRDIASTLDITERTAYGIVTDLTDAGYVVKEKDGRRNRYEIQAHLPLREPISRERTIGEVLGCDAECDPNQPTGEVTRHHARTRDRCGGRGVGGGRAAAARQPSTSIRWAVTGRRVPDRLCFWGILIRLTTGSSWVDIEAILEHRVSDTTLRARRDEWIAAGVFEQLKDEALAAFDRIIGLDLSEVSVDGSLHKAPYGGEGTGPNPTDRGKLGWKWSVGVGTSRRPDRLGDRRRQPQRRPHARSRPSRPIAAAGLLVDIDTLHLDRGYDYPVVRERLAAFGLDDLNIQRRGTKEPGTQAAGPARAALDRRGDQLVVVELRPATPQHRPPTAATDTPPSASPPPSSSSANSSPGATAGAQPRTNDR